MALTIDRRGFDRFGRRAAILTLCAAIMAGLYFVFLYLVASH